MINANAKVYGKKNMGTQIQVWTHVTYICFVWVPGM